MGSGGLVECGMTDYIFRKERNGHCRTNCRNSYPTLTKLVARLNQQLQHFRGSLEQHVARMTVARLFDESISRYSATEGSPMHRS